MIGTLRVSARLRSLPAHFDPRHLRQHPIQQHQIGNILVRQHQRFVAVARFDRAIAFLFDIVPQQRHQRRFVFGDQNQWVFAARSCARPFDRRQGLSCEVMFVVDVISLLGRASPILAPVAT